MDTAIFTTMTMTSFSSGALVTTQRLDLAEPRLARAGAADRARAGLVRGASARRRCGRAPRRRPRRRRAPSRRPGRSGTGGTRSARSTSARGAIPSAASRSAASCRGSGSTPSSRPGARCRRASSARPGAGRSRSVRRGRRVPSRRAGRSVVVPSRPLALRAGAVARCLAGDLDPLAVGRVDHQRAGQVGGQRRRGPLERIAAVEHDRMRRRRRARRCGARSRPSGTRRRWRRSAPRRAHARRGLRLAGAAGRRAAPASRTAAAARTRSGAAARARGRRRSAPPRSRSCPSRSTGRAARRPRRGVPRQPAAASIAAASVSFSGASPCVLAPAALEQRLARAVDVDRGALGADVQDDAQVGPHRVDVRPLAVLVAHPVADGVLDAQRGEVQALQRAALRGAVDAQRLARRDPVRPGEPALLTIWKIFCGRLRQVIQTKDV